MNHRLRLTIGCRAKALEAGLWQRADGRTVRLAEMHPAHLVNAYLGALAAGEPEGITRPLAEAVVTRGLAEAARAEAERRSRTCTPRASRRPGSSPGR